MTTIAKYAPSANSDPWARLMSSITPNDEHEAERDEREQQAEAQTVQEMGNDVRHDGSVRNFPALASPRRRQPCS